MNHGGPSYVAPDDPLLPLLPVREDLHVLIKAAPATVSVLNPWALYLRRFAVAYGPPEFRLSHGQGSCPRDDTPEVKHSDLLGEIAECVC